MKTIKQLLRVIALAALTGFSLTACGDKIDGVNTANLLIAIENAYDAKNGVKTANDASEVISEYFWVTQSVMDTFNEAINAAQEVYDHPVSQPAVDAAEQTLNVTVTFFKSAIKPGTNTDFIKLSGTVQVTVNGQTVPYVSVYASTGYPYAWSETYNIPLGETTWEIYAPSFSSDTDIYFTISGSQNNTYDGKLFNVDIDTPVIVNNQDVSDIDFNLENINTIKLSGTVQVTVNGQPVPYVTIEAYASYPSSWGETYNIPLGETTWEMYAPSFSSDTNVYFYVSGSQNNTYNGELFYVEIDTPVIVRNQNVSNINFNLGNINTITLSGTLNISGLPDTIKSAWIGACREDDYITYSIGSTSLQWSGSSSSTQQWSINIPVQDTETEIGLFLVAFSSSTPWEGEHIIGWLDSGKRITVKDQDVSGIDIVISYITLSGTINISEDVDIYSDISRIDINISGDVYGSTSFQWSGPNTQWSINKILVLNPETEIYLTVTGYSDDESYLFSWNGSGQPITVKDKDVSGIAIYIDQDKNGTITLE